MRRVVVLLLLAGCSLKADYGGTTFACGTGDTCPDGYACVAERCVPAEPPPPACATAVGAGVNHACAIRSDGTAWCWGANSDGQLGDSTTTDRSSPVAVVATGLPKLTAIAGGAAHTCALGADQTVWCWGANAAGQLGNSTYSPSRTPVPVTGLTQITAVVAGTQHSCALDTAGRVQCWGASDAGELGNGTLGESTKTSTPVTVQLGAAATMIAAFSEQTCAVEATGAVECWGNNNLGQLGNGKNGNAEPSPVTMQLPAGASRVAVGDQFTCALTTDHAVYCAGRNFENELGPVPDNAFASVPVQVPLDVSATAIFAGDRFACAVDDHGKAWCWGVTDDFQLPAGDASSPRVYPARIDYPDVKLASAGSRFMCVQSTDGLRCGGFNGFGQLGDGARTTDPTPTAIDGLASVTAVALGDSFTCATLADKTAMCWGKNDRGQLGDGTFTGHDRPVAVTGLANVTKVATGRNHACALLGDATVKCWGNNDNGQLGDGSSISRSAPRLVMDGAAPLAGVVDIAVGINHSCAALQNDMMKCWGGNNAGQLGSPPSSSVAVPTPVMPPPGGAERPKNVAHMSAGDQFTCAIDGFGQTWCWGKNDINKLGNATIIDGTATPTVVPLLKTVTVDQLTTRTTFTCAHVKTTNDVWCWGLNNDNQLAGASPSGCSLPVKLSLAGATQISAGDDHACALTGDQVACWGGDELGAVGQAVYASYPAAQSVTGLAGVTAIATGFSHTCAVTAGGQLLCWGDNRDGELGDGISRDAGPVAPLLACPK